METTKCGKVTGSSAIFNQWTHSTGNVRVCVCVCVCAHARVCMVQAHQAVQASSQEIHCTHLHGGHLGYIDWRSQIQVQQVTQQVALAGDHMMLVHGSCRPTTHWALACINAGMEGNHLEESFSFCLSAVLYFFCARFGQNQQNAK